MGRCAKDFTEWVALFWKPIDSNFEGDKDYRSHQAGSRASTLHLRVSLHSFSVLVEDRFWFAEGRCRFPERCKGGGGKKNTFKSRFFFSDAGLPSRQCRQDKPTQAKGSLRCQMTLSESGWCLAEVVEIHLTNYVKLRSFLGSRHLCHNVSLFSFGK